MGPMRNWAHCQEPEDGKMGYGMWQVNGLAGLGIRSLGLAQTLTAPRIFGESCHRAQELKDLSPTLTSKRTA